jgi:putative phosphonate transport system ATP-binding protein
MIGNEILLEARDVTVRYGLTVACDSVSLDLRAGEVLGIVGESGSGKTSLLTSLSGRLKPSSGQVMFDVGGRGLADVYELSEPERRRVRREEWGFVHQNPRDGLRLRISAGGNIVEPLLMCGERHYDRMRSSALDWLDRVELDTARIDQRPSQFSGGMQQRVQIARALAHQPRLVFMDEPTGGLDVSVQARLLDLLRSLVRELGLAVMVVTHDLAVARLLADRLMVMKNGHVVEAGLTDQVLDDPQHAYTQLLVSAAM